MKEIIKTHTFTNGLNLLSIQDTSSQSTSIQAYIKVGSATETPYLGTGISHFLEHMLAGNASKTYSEQETNTLLKELGGMFNAYTSYDHTQYHINTYHEKTSLALDLILEWLFFAKLEKSVFEREQNVIQREIEKYKASVNQSFYQACEQHFYKESSKSYPIIGELELFNTLKLSDLKQHYHNHYITQNTLICIGSAEPIETHIDAIDNKNIPKIPIKIKETVPYFIRNKPACISKKNIEQESSLSKVSIRFPTCQFEHQDIYALDLISIILSHGEESLLNKTLIHEQNCCYSVYAQHSTNPLSNGYFEIYAESKAFKHEAFTQACFKILKKIETKKY
eukprot:COSAG01_NODE_713_length_14097_cov_15.136448_1_plen_338_part_00